MRVNPLKTILCGMVLAGSALLLPGCGGPAPDTNQPQTAAEAQKRSMDSIPGYAKKDAERKMGTKPAQP